jgi:hypothetical protein
MFFRNYYGFAGVAYLAGEKGEARRRQAASLATSNIQEKPFKLAPPIAAISLQSS